MTELIWEGKYKDGKKVTPVRIALPFQTIETVNESSQQRQKTLDFFASELNVEYNKWRNRLIWGDKKYVLPSLLPEFAGKVNLIYIDPPFNVGADFSFTANIPDDPDTEENEITSFLKQPSIIEQKAYRDTWGRGLDSYMQWFYEAILLLKEFLTTDGSIYVHLDWHVGHYAKVILDEVFGQQNFRNEIIWYYYNKFQGNINRFASNHDIIYWYSNGSKYIFNKQRESRGETVKQIKRVWSKEKGSIVNAKGEDGKVIYIETDERTIDDVWRLSMLQPADRTENLFYPTQKPQSLLERIIKASSNEGDLVLDCFGGSGTTAATAEKNNRKWIACDLGRFAIHTTRKRLLAIENVKPFIVQNLGKYERQQWMKAEFDLPVIATQSGAKGKQSPANDEIASSREKAEIAMKRRVEQEKSYKHFIVELYHGKTLDGYTWLHGAKAGRMIHVGSVDAPVTVEDIKSAIKEFWKLVGKDKNVQTNGIDFLGWDFAFDVNETAKQFAAENKVNVSFKKIPREVLEKKAVEQGDIKFYELAALKTKVDVNKKKVMLTLDNFIMPQDDLPDDVRGNITHWSQWIDYWAVDWNFRDDTFHNEWQSYRTKQNPKIDLSAVHAYEEKGKYTVVVKVIDILGNDTTKTIEVNV